MTPEQIQALIAENDRLAQENDLLRRTIKIQKRQMKQGSVSDEVRRLRAKIAEWEGSVTLINGGYYHGDRFIRPYLDDDA